MVKINILGSDNQEQTGAEEPRLDELDKDKLHSLVDWHASDVFPPLPDSRKGSVYRRTIAYEFASRRGNVEPRRLDDGTQYRSEDMSRLDRAIDAVASAHDRYEDTVQQQSIWAVYSGDNQKLQFLQDLLEIENRVVEEVK